MEAEVTANALAPLAEAASEITPPLKDELDSIQVAPELVEKMILPTLFPATSLVPSAEEATSCKSATGVLFEVQVAPPSVER